MLIVSEKWGSLETVMILKSYEATSCDLLRLWYTMCMGVCIRLCDNIMLIDNQHHLYHSLTQSYGFGGLSDSQRNMVV